MLILLGKLEEPFASGCKMIAVGDLLLEVDGIVLKNIGIQRIARMLQELVVDAEKVGLNIKYDALP
jgi:hypothetical protein